MQKKSATPQGPAAFERGHLSDVEVQSLSSSLRCGRRPHRASLLLLLSVVSLSWGCQTKPLRFVPGQEGTLAWRPSPRSQPYYRLRHTTRDTRPRPATPNRRSAHVLLAQDKTRKRLQHKGRTYRKKRKRRRRRRRAARSYPSEGQLWAYTDGHRQSSLRIVKAVELALQRKSRGAHCWDWVWRIYRTAGFGAQGRNKMQFIRTLFVGSQYRHWRKYHRRPRKFLPRRLYAKLRPGDWVYSHNRNRYDKQGNHSIVFLRWASKRQRMAWVAGNTGAYKAGHKYITDFRRKPITYVMRPIALPSSRPKALGDLALLQHTWSPLALNDHTSPHGG